MKRHSGLLYLLGFIIVTFLVHSCAIEQAPLGGGLDDIPPFPDSLKSSANKQLFFEKQEIELVFDEWVQLKNASQIVVSPPLVHGIEAKLKGKKLILSFDKEEVLLDNTTYSINMGESIVDYTVGNPMKNYSFVFSTGAYLDSLSVKGKVLDDFTGEPVENVIVSVYDDLRDSSIYLTRPLYFSRTDENGQFQINNMRSDTFRIFALDDKNLNYYKDQESEAIGFMKDLILLDSSYNSVLKIGYFLPEPSLRVVNKSVEGGKIALSFNRDASDLSFRIVSKEENYQRLQKKDSLFVFYKEMEGDTLFLDLAADKTDTLLFAHDSLRRFQKLKLSGANANLRKTLGPTDSLELYFATPVKSWDKDKFILKDTSGTAVTFGMLQDREDPRILRLKRSWLEGQKHELIILPDAITDILGLTNDTLVTPFIVSNSISLGEIIFELDSLQKDFNYIVELGQGKKVIARKYVKNSLQAKLSFQSLGTGQYVTKIYEDRNGNGRWDAGNYLEKIYSEKWVSKKLESLKAGWTLEVTVNGNEFK